jgi:hypothetical protein
MAQHRTTFLERSRIRGVRGVRAVGLIGCVGLLVIAAGCGAGHKATATTQTPTTRTNPQDKLTNAARATLRANHRIAKLVLWKNAVPGSATKSTRGPALAALRSAAADRRRRGIHIKVVFDDFRIESITLDPSFTRATALVTDPQRVQPYGSDGKPLGQPVRLSEKSRFELHRLGSSQRFVVWQVKPAR